MKNRLKKIYNRLNPSFRFLLEKLINCFRVFPYAYNRMRYSYYNDRAGKTFLRRYLEILSIVTRSKANDPEMYYAFGLDCVGTNLHDYVFPGEYLRAEDHINDLNNPFYFGFTDKRITNIILNHYGLPHNKAHGVLDINSDGQLQVSLLNGGTISWHNFLAKKTTTDLFCKPLIGKAGRGAFRLTRRDIREILDMNDFTIKKIHDLLILPSILEEVIENHPLIAEFHPESLNTLRLVTVMKGFTPYLLGAIFRIGTGTHSVDNTSSGGIAIQVDIATGKLAKTGYQKPSYGFLHTEHPDTHIIFEGRVIPFWDKICTLVIDGHSLLREPHTIGWDISITSNGPLIVELNRYPDPYIQANCGSWRKFFDEFYITEIEKLEKIRNLKTL